MAYKCIGKGFYESEWAVSLQHRRKSCDFLKLANQYHSKQCEVAQL